MKSPLISVVIPCFNSATYLPEAIESVLSQSYRNFEIIVVNDGSTDNTDEVIQQHLDRIIFIQQDNAGPAAARNRGIREALGKYVAFLDADDTWLPDKLQNQITILESDADCALVYTRFANYEESSGKSLPTLSDTPSGMIFDKLLVESIILLSTVVIRREVLLEAGCFDESLLTAEDTNLWLKVARKHRIDAVPEVLVRRRWHGANISSRVDIPVGTLDNLDRIVAIYPDTAPDRYEPMKRAYQVRGTAMASDLFCGGNYKECRRVCRRLSTIGIRNPQLARLSLMSLFPVGLISALRRLSLLLHL